MSMRLVALALLAPGCGAFGTCREVREEGPGLTGMLSYALGDGTRLEGTLERSRVDITGTNEVTIDGTFLDAFARDRHYTLQVGDLAPGANDVDARGAFCLVRQTGAPPVCSDVTGTIDVRKLAYDCYEHESGISACAKTHDLTLHVASTWHDTRFALDGDDLKIGSWVDTECSD